jgi:hypothetical protein
MWQQDMNTTQQVALGFAASESRFATAFIARVAASNANGVSLQQNWRTETCAALWAAVLTTFETSHYSKDEQEVLLPMVLQHMAPFWARHCGAEPGVIQQLIGRAEHYQRSGEPGDVVQRAISIVNALLEATVTADISKSVTAQVLTTLLSQRMLADLARLDALNGRNSSTGLTKEPALIRLGRAVAAGMMSRH